MSEVKWADLPEPWDRFQVSTDAQVRARQRDGNWRILVHNYDASGHHWVQLVTGPGRRKSAFVARLMAGAFIPGSGACVRHLDGNPHNNTLENLAWGSHSDNSMDTVRHGRNPSQNRTHCPQGHPYDGENTLRYRGFRYCRACVKANSAVYRQQRREREGTSPRAKLTPSQVSEIRRRAAAGEPRRLLREEYGVGKTALHNIVSGLAWREVA